MPMTLKVEVDEARRLGGGAKPVDLVYLSRQTMGDPGLEAEVLRIFLTQARVCLEAWKQALNDAARKEAAHALKGSARAIGAFALADHAAAAEIAGYRDIAALEAEMERVFAYIRTLL
jgi:HPt (histidine-containing phosphotransfer) domain-containing protein